MKHLIWFFITTFVVLIVVSCGTTSTPLPMGNIAIPTSSSTLTLSPVPNVIPEITQIEFLVDNTNSVENESKGGCGKRLGKGRFDFVRFITGVLRDSIPSQYSQNLFIGVSVFGNQFSSLLSPIALNAPFSIVASDAPTNNTKYTLGIQGALNKMYEQGQLAKRHYLVLITDGETETESIETVEAELKKQTTKYNDPNLHVYIALLCSRNSQVWFDKVHQLDVADVFVGLENVTKNLFEDLDGFLPSTGKLILPSSGQSAVQVAGDATSVNISYWSPDADGSNYLGIYDGSIGFSRSLVGLETYPYIASPLVGCSPHSFVIDPPPTNNWFLFVQPRTFQSLEFTLRSSNGESLEIINDNPLSFQFEITDSSLNVDMSKWKDCFSAQLIWKTYNQLNQESGGEVDFVPCLGVQYLCYTDTQWSPRFTDLGDVEIKIKLKTLDGDFWESEPTIFPIKFKAGFDYVNAMPYTIDGQQIVQKDFVFDDVSSVSQVDIYMVSSTGKLDDNSCPNSTHTVNNLRAHKLVPLPAQQCDSLSFSDTAEGNRVCVSYASLAPLDYVYTLRVYDRITNFDCQYDQLFFEWHSDKYTKEVVWRCDFRKNNDCTIVSKLIVVPFP